MTLNPPQDFRSTDKTHRSGLAVDKPAAADVLPGTLYFSTDTSALERSDGITWSTYSGGGGAPGPAGPTGKTGNTGNSGYDGTDGDDGFMYPPGKDGTIGPRGFNGSLGLNGPAGLDGEDGLEGFPLPGPVGNTGTTGNTGAQGIPGPAGLPANLIPYFTEPEEPLEPVVLIPQIPVLPPLVQLFNSDVTTPGAGFASDTYLAGSRILIPANYPKVGTRYRLVLAVSKTGAGVAAAVFTVRYGTAGAIGDNSRFVFTFGIQSGVIDTGTFELYMHFRVAGAVAVLAGFARCLHHLAATGLTTTGAAGNGIIIPAPSSAFDATPANSFIGVSLNAGSLAVWTVSVVEAELEG